MKVLNDQDGRINGLVRLDLDELTLLEEACEVLAGDIIEEQHPDVVKLRKLTAQFAAMFELWGK